MKMIDNLKKRAYNFVMGGKPMIEIEDKNIDLNSEQIENEIWYNGNSPVLSDYYGQFSNPRNVKFNYFWAKSFNYLNIRKIHSGLPAMMVDKLV